MRVRLVASLLSAFIVATAGVGVGSSVPAAAGFHSPAPAKANNAVEFLSPKLRAADRMAARRSLSAATPQLASSVPCTQSWNVVASPDASAGRNDIVGVAALAPNDVWAVGYYVNGSSVFQTLAEHWDGSAWSIVPTPDAGPGNNLLTGVAAISGSDVWAAGYWRTAGGTSAAQPLAEHWNGSAWTIVGAPVVPNTSSLLFGVNADASNDVWAVGLSQDFPVSNLGPHGHPFVMQWIGGTWSVATPTPTMPSLDVSSLNGVKALSPTNVWAVGDGQDFTGSTPVSNDTSIVEHWDGTSWTQFSPPLTPNGDFLSGVDGTANDLWAVGGQVSTSTTDSVLIDHWGGTGWSQVTGITPDLSANLFAVGYISGNNVYAAGASAYTSPSTNLEQDNTVIEHWNGSGWTQSASINPTSSQALFTIAALTANVLWVGGAMVVNGYDQTLTENFCAPPAVTGIAPSSGTGGSTVVITGSGLSKAIAVDFGTTPAFSFHVDSDTQIRAIAPPGHKTGTVDVTVTVEGTSSISTPDQFTYLVARDQTAAGPGPFFHPRAAPPVSKLVAAMSTSNRALLDIGTASARAAS